MRDKNTRRFFSNLFALSFCGWLWLATLPASVYSQETLDEDAQISLLTVYPRDKAVYAIFGHTAVRIKSEKQGLDLIFNYGYFDSSKPGFIYHFVKGETDYILGIDDYEHFLYQYALDNSRIDEQELQLTAGEKRNIVAFLQRNAQPENREYRYDYFFDNCTTRPRDIFENCTKGTISYPPQQTPTSLRTLVHECTKPYPWLEFGIDLVVGSGADSTISARSELFLPIKLMRALDETQVIADSVSYSLVKSRTTLLKGSEGNLQKETSKDAPLSPGAVASLLLLATAGVSMAGYRKKRLFRGFDMALFAAAGIAGVIVSFICFVSTHPCTSVNYNLAWLHPLHLLAAVCFPIKSFKKYNYWYHLINFVALSMFLAGWKFLPQEMPGAGILIACCLWVRSGYNIFFYLDDAKEKRKRRNNT